MPRSLSIQQREKRLRLARLAQAPAAAKKPAAAISAVSATVVQEPVSKRKYLILSIQTDSGITGIGEATADSLPEIAQLKEQLVGHDALAAEVVLQHLKKLGQRPQLLAAVHMALLDILGKQAKAPVHEILGGPTRSKARVLASVPDGAAPALFAGFRAFSVPVAVEKGIRPPTFFKDLVSTLTQTRKGVVDNSIDFVFDIDGRLPPGEVAALARELEKHRLLFLDEPCRPAPPATVRKITDDTVVPVGLGKHATSVDDFFIWLKAETIDVLRPNLALLSLSDIRKAAALAETHYVAVAPVNLGGPIATAAGLHLAAALPNFFILEVPWVADDKDRQMRLELAGIVEKPDAGFLPLPTKPGLGVELNAEAVRKYQVK